MSFAQLCFCFIGDDIKEGDIRLVPGNYLWQGLVEIYLDGIWGAIDHYYHSGIVARVVCRQLGYNTDGNIFIWRQIISLHGEILNYIIGKILYSLSVHISCDLNYSTAGAYDDRGPRGKISDLFHLSWLYCYGREYRISDCLYNDYIDVTSRSYYKLIVYCSEG